jgi:hypothetical protein
MREGLKIGLILLAGLFLMWLLYSGGCIPRPMRYDLPDGYKGWLEVTYYDPHCQPLGNDGITIVLVVSSDDGLACSSSPMPHCWLIDWGSYVREDGTRATVRAHAIATTGANKKMIVFVGTAEDRKNAGPGP